MPESLESINSRLAHVEERLHRLEQTEEAWRNLESRLRALEQGPALATEETAPQAASKRAVAATGKV